MPFNATGTYTPATGATTAAPGQLIRSAIWNGIFTDLSAALTQLGTQLLNTQTVTSGPYTSGPNDTFILTNQSAALTINLPAAATRNGFPLSIKDISGNAHTNAVTITANGTENIEGNTNIFINVDWGGWNLFPVTGGWILHP